MKRSLVALGLLLLSGGAAAATPGDPRVVQGTLEWPALVANEPFIVVRGEDGRLYYADITAAQRRTPEPMRSGSRVAVLGVEGARPHELAAMAVGAGDAASLGLTPSTGTPAPAASIPSAPAPTAAAVAPPAPPAEPLWRVDGTVQSITGTTVSVRTSDGGTTSVDVSQLSDQTVRALRAGERISLFGVPRQDRRLVANGYIQNEAGSPAASPRTTR